MNKTQKALLYLLSLSEDERAEVVRQFCKSCYMYLENGTVRCYCENDE